MSNILLKIDNVTTTVIGRLPSEVYKEFKEHLGYVPENALWQMKSNPYFPGYFTCVCWNRDKCRCSVKKDGMHFPTGLISLAIDFFKLNNIPYSIKDDRDITILNSLRENPYTLAPTLLNAAGTEDKLAFHEYQSDTIKKSIYSQRGIIQVATGGGKTLIGSGIIIELGVKPTIFYVTSIDLLNQAVKDISDYVRLSGEKISVGAIGGGNKKIGDITVMTVQTAIRALNETYKKFDEEDEQDNTDITDIKSDIVDLIHSAKLIIADECQHMASETCQTIADNSFNARWRYGMSATPYRDKGDDILITACFGKKICEINASYLIQRGFLVKPNIAFLKIDNMKGQKLGPWPSVYKSAITDNDYRNTVIKSLSENLYNQNRSILILISQISHGEILNDLIPNSVFIHGSSGKSKRKEHLDIIRQGKPSITIASSILDEGVDVKPLNSLILAGGGKSATRALQRIGRIIRNYTYADGTKKKDAFIYDFNDHQKYLTDHYIARRKIYMTEPEFVIQNYNLE